MSNKKERLTEQKLAEQYVMDLFESIQYLPESEQEAFLVKMNEAGKGGLINKVKAMFGDPKAQLADLTKKLQDIDATFGQIITAIDEAAKLNPGIPAETVEADKAKVAEFQKVFQGLAAEANGISASMEASAGAAPAAEDKAASTDAGEANAEANAEGGTEGKADGAPADETEGTATVDDKVKANEDGTAGGVNDLSDEEEQERMGESKENLAGNRA